MSASQETKRWLEFRTTPQTFQIGKISVGGQPGVRPAVLIGSMFYHGHKVLIDEDRGEFDRDAAARAIRQHEELSAAHWQSVHAGRCGSHAGGHR